MKTKSTSQSAFNLRVLIGIVSLAGVFLALVGVGALSNAFAQAKLVKPEQPTSAMADAAPPGHPASAVLWAQAKLFHVPAACDPGPWSTATTGPATRYRAGGVSDGTFVYVFGGGTSTGTYLNDLWRWDPSTQTWTQLANMPTGKQNIQGAYWNGKIYVPGGYIGSHITENAIYDIATNTWTTGAPLPAAQTGTNVAFNNRIYNFGGNPGPQTTTTIYDITLNTWLPGAPMPVATTYGRAAVAGSFAYYVGGIAAATTNAVHRYDLTTGTWTTMNPLQTARTSEELMTSPDGSKLFAVMGGNATFFTGVPLAQSVEIYNIGTNAWSYGNPVVTKAAAPSGGLAGGKAMVQGGVDNTTYYNTVQVSVTSCAPTVTSAVSRKTHGAAGDFDVVLPLSGTSAIEDRSGGATNDFTIVVTFTGNVAVSGSPQAEVTSGTGTVGSGGVSNGGMVTVSGNIVTIPLTNVADQQTIQVRLNGVNSARDTPAADVTIPMSLLLGDSNGNGAVNAGDISQTKGRSGQAVTSANFRSDFNANGSINAGDISVAKANTGHAVVPDIVCAVDDTGMMCTNPGATCRKNGVAGTCQQGMRCNCQ